MKTDDQRNVICGGDPENYLKAYLKGLYFDLDDGDEIIIEDMDSNDIIIDDDVKKPSKKTVHEDDDIIIIEDDDHPHK